MGNNDNKATLTGVFVIFAVLTSAFLWSCGEGGVGGTGAIGLPYFFRTDATVSFPGTGGTAVNTATTSPCPSGMIALGGGGIQTGGIELFVSGTGPSGTASGFPTDTWLMSWSPSSPGGGTATVSTWAVCTLNTMGYSIVRTDATLSFPGAGGTAVNTATTSQCPSGMIAIGGGGIQTGGIELFVSGTGPSGTASGFPTDTWSTSWYPSSPGGGTATVSTWAVCTLNIQGSSIVRTDATVSFPGNGGTAINTATTSQCPSGMIAIGGGGMQTGGIILFVSGTGPGGDASGLPTDTWSMSWSPYTPGGGTATVSTWAVCTAT